MLQQTAATISVTAATLSCSDNCSVYSHDKQIEEETSY